ncbi:hypothetical protein CW740_02565 [Kangiella profundi]|uniref:Uncharacterized protein n=1 Tax=Kangiella profundi TaxID=1561924 RepID=A0A2K9A606_9GAMM|nr:hypothetical protein [Kangiella profundi]AUD78180.1 hypothetical protein CW740_02565 [Kangiella profundi]GGF05779.1 hypothetical protein GCM10011356_19180 [Kangiella profundi]
MKKLLMTVLVLAISGCQTNSKQATDSMDNVTAPGESQKPLFYTPEQIQKIQFSEQAGYLIWIKDSLAWTATDKVREELDLSTIDNPLGWLVHLDPEGNHRVSFYRSNSDGEILSFADVFYNDSFEISGFEAHPKRAVTEDEIVMLTALSSAGNSITEACSENLNSVVLEDDDGWNVFFLTPPTDPGVIPIGGAQRLLVSKDGKSVMEHEHYSKSCMNLQPQGEDVHALMMTHIVDEIPSPVHVFTSLSYDYPLYVATSLGLWQVIEGDIEEVKDAN